MILCNYKILLNQRGNKKMRPIKKALIIVDMVNGFISEGNLHDPAINKITKTIVELAKAYIANGDKIIAFKDCHTPNSPELEVMPPHCMKGTSEVEQVAELKKLESSPYMEVVEKNCTDGFMVPGMPDKLKGFDELVVVGCCTDICVKNFVISAKNYFNQRNERINIIVPENAVETYHIAEVHERDEWNNMAFKFMQQASIKVVKEVTPEITPDANIDGMQKKTNN